MKPSHTTTPRTLSDTVFIINADPIERPETGSPIVIKLYVWALCIAAVLVAALRLA